MSRPLPREGQKHETCELTEVLGKPPSRQGLGAWHPSFGTGYVGPHLRLRGGSIDGTQRHIESAIVAEPDVFGEVARSETTGPLERFTRHRVKKPV